MKYILFLFLLSIMLTFMSGENYSLSNNYDINEESITVLLKSYEEEVLQCTIQVETSEDQYYDFYTIYDKNELINTFSIFKYIGDKNNSCSFIIYPEHYSFKYYFDKPNVFNNKWIIIEKYLCDKSFWNIVTLNYDTHREGCYREYNIFFNPKTSVEIMSMTLAKTKIIRKAPYDNKTLTVHVQSEAEKITICKLSLNTNFFNHKGNEIIIYNKYLSYLSQAEYGIEYIGLEDNSCSMRIYLDVLNKTNSEDKLLNQDWKITVDGGKSSIYNFYMYPKEWWNVNHYSKVFLRKKFPLSTDAQYF